MSEGLQEGFLHNVLGIFAVMCNVLRDAKQLAIVSRHKLLESGDVSILSGMDEVQFIAGYNPRCDLCQVCSHVRFRIGTTTPFRPPCSPAARRFNAPRSCRSSSGGLNNSRNTFPPC